MWYKNILETIGNTPMVQLNKVVEGIPATVLAKVETFNPGNSIKDRMALSMIEAAEKDGTLKPGGLIIEGTSGNTGMGLAIVAIIKGYRCIFTTTDKQSKEKMDALRAFGAEVIVCPTSVAPEDPRSYYSVAARIHKENPGSFYPNQYDNLANRQAHYETTGPEIWEQTEGKITHLVVGVGTGGTISGTAKYLKEKNPNIKIWGIDSYGSLFKKYHETGEIDEKEVYSYITEGIGEDFLPKNVDFTLIDHFEKVTDKDAAVYTREIVKKEGIWVGNSAGSAIGGLHQMKDKLKKEDVVVVIFHDHGSRYVAKFFNDDWMRDRGFIPKQQLSAADIVARKPKQELTMIDENELVQNAVNVLHLENVSQLPVTQNGTIIGKITESEIYHALVENPSIRSEKISKIMSKPFPFVKSTSSIEDLSKLLNKKNEAVLMKDDKGQYQIITEFDVIQAIGS